MRQSTEKGKITIAGHGKPEIQHPEHEGMQYSECLCGSAVEIAMEKSLEQRYAINVCVKLGKTPGHTYRKNQEAFGDGSIIKLQLDRWHKMFRECRENVTDDAHCGRPASSRGDTTVASVRELLNGGQRMNCGC